MCLYLCYTLQTFVQSALTLTDFVISSEFLQFAKKHEKNVKFVFVKSAVLKI